MTTIVVAYDEARGIGKYNSIPWHLPEDLKHFKRLTNNQICVMGRNTWESLPEKFRPLPSRVNIIISSSYVDNQDKFLSKFCGLHNAPLFCFEDLDSALNSAKLLYPDKEIFVIGGGQLYKAALEKNLVDEMIVSEVEGCYDCDTFFPEVDHNWSRQVVEKYDDFTVSRYIKEN